MTDILIDDEFDRERFLFLKNDDLIKQKRKCISTCKVNKSAQFNI